VVILRPGRSFLCHCLLLPHVKRVASPRPFPADDTACFARNHVGRRVGSVFNADGYDGPRARESRVESFINRAVRKVGTRW